MQIGKVVSAWDLFVVWQGDSPVIIEQRSRFFIRHQLRFRACRQHGLPLPLVSNDKTLDAFSTLKEAANNGTAEFLIKETDVVRLTKVEKRDRQNVVIFLFRRSDPKAPTPIFEHRRTRKLRKAEKDPEEGLAISAHLFVHLEKMPDAAHPSYHAILEEVPGLSKTYIHTIISEVLRNKKYSYQDKYKEEKETYSVADLDGVKTEKIGSALEKSTVPHVTLVRPGKLEGFDTEGLVAPRDERMKVVMKGSSEDSLRKIQQLVPWAKKNAWSDVLVQVDLPEDRSRVVSVARDADAANVLFVKSELVKVNKDIDPCTENFNEELVAKALEMFRNDSIV